MLKRVIHPLAYLPAFVIVALVGVVPYATYYLAALAGLLVIARDLRLPALARPLLTFALLATLAAGLSHVTGPGWTIHWALPAFEPLVEDLRSWVWMGTMLTLSLVGVDWAARVIGAKGVGLALLVGVLAHAPLVWLQHDGTSLAAGARALGMTPNPNILGATAVMVAVAAMARAPASFAWPTAAIAFLFVLASGSRTAFVTAVVLLAMHAAWAMVKRRWRTVLLHGVLTVAAVAVGVLGNQRFLTSASLQDVNVVARLEIFGLAWQALLENPIAGVGWGSLTTFIADRAPKGFLTPDAGHAHNIVLQFGAEGGLVLLAGLAILAVAWFRHAVMTKSRGALMGLVGFMLLAMFDAAFLLAYTVMPLWLALTGVAAKEANT